MNEETGSASVGNASTLVGDFPMLVAEYLHKVAERLARESDDGWLLSIETRVEYTFNANRTKVERKGGSYLISKAHGQIAELTIRPDDLDVVVDVEPSDAMPWSIAKILMLR